MFYIAVKYGLSMVRVKADRFSIQILCIADCKGMMLMYISDFEQRTIVSGLALNTSPEYNVKWQGVGY